MFIEVTQRCNLSCKYCYFPKGQKDRPLDSIMAEAVKMRDFAPFIITGGEPTIRDDIFEVCRSINTIGRAHLLTNGTRTSNLNFLKELVAANYHDSDISCVNLSIHEEAKEHYIGTMANMMNIGKRFQSVLCVVDTLDDVGKCIALYDVYKRAIGSMRIKIATNTWSENRANHNLFVSDLWKRLKRLKPSAEILKADGFYNKARYVNVFADDQIYMIMSWPDISNVDLLDLDHPPYYLAYDGNYYNNAITNIVNQGIIKGGSQGDQSVARKGAVGMPEAV